MRWDVIREHGVFGKLSYVQMRTPGFGNSDWTRIISELRLARFTGSIDIEGWHDPVDRDALEMTGQVRALTFLKECRGALRVRRGLGVLRLSQAGQDNAAGRGTNVVRSP